jgi:hypothetical protein
MPVPSDFVPIRGFSGYFVNRRGDVASVHALGACSGTMKHDFRILSKTPGVQGYVKVSLSARKKRRVTLLVHRIVAEHFLPRERGKSWVNHKNGIKTDNRVENLEWATPLENVRHCISVLGIRPKRTDLKLNHKKAEKIKLKLRQGCAQKEIAKEFGISISSVSLIKNGRRWKSEAPRRGPNSASMDPCRA